MSSVPQIVPSRACFTCDVCCRFPELDSRLRPYFTAAEIRRAITQGIDPSHFPNLDGCQVSVIPNPSGEGYHCPAFDLETFHCRIYHVRPLDCQIYPFAVMWSLEGAEVLLGWDTKCPFMSNGGHSTRSTSLDSSFVPGLVQNVAHSISERLEEEDLLRIFAQNPQLVTDYQEDVVVVIPLHRLTQALLTVRGHPRAALPD